MSTQTKEIIENLKANKELTIVGPSYSDPNNLRIYSYGGLIGGIPVNDLSWWKLPDENYLNVEFKGNDKDALDKYLKAKDSLDKFLSGEKNCKNNRDKKQYRQTLYSNPEFISAITTFAKERFTSLSSTEQQERAIQTKIVKKYLSEKKENSFIVCDMEHCVPKKEYSDGCTTYLTQYENYFSEPTNYKEKTPKFDIIAINPDSKKIGFIELKCNKKACLNGSGLKVHLKDTLASMDLPRVRERIADRFACLRDFGFLPAELKGIESAFLDYKAFCGFLFVKGTDLQTKASAIEICETALEEILIGENDIKDRLLFLFAENADSVNLNEMQPWDEFCK